MTPVIIPTITAICTRRTYRIKALVRGTCRRGERADLTHCTPVQRVVGSATRPAAPNQTGATAAPRTAASAPRKRVRRGYRDGLPKLDVTKSSIEILPETWLKKYELLKECFADPTDSDAWNYPIGWGRVRLDPAKLKEKFSPDELKDIMDRGWISVSQLVGGGEIKDIYNWTHTGRIARIFHQRGITKLTVPKTKAEADQLADLLEYDGVISDSDFAKKIAEQLGLAPPIYPTYTATDAKYPTPDEVKKFRRDLHEMLYRHYNPVPIQDRIAKNRKLQEKVKKIVDMPDTINKTPEIQTYAEMIKQKEQQGSVLSSEVRKVAEALFGSNNALLPQEEKDKLKTRLKELRDQYKVYATPLYKMIAENGALYRAAASRIIDDTLHVKNPTPVRVQPLPGSPSEDIAAGKLPTANWKLTDAEKTSIIKAEDWLTGKIAKGPNGEELPAYKIINDDTPYGGRSGPSAFYRSSEHAINVPTGMRSVQTNVHEMGHGIEYKMPGVQSAVQRFLAYRVKDEPLKKLKELFPNSGYGSDEEGRSDDFGKVFDSSSAWYVGKHYKDGATEVLSMGLETLHSDPVYFCTKDPEYAAFVLGIMDGSLRDNPVPEK